MSSVDSDGGESNRTSEMRRDEETRYDHLEVGS